MKITELDQLLKRTRAMADSRAVDIDAVLELGASDGWGRVLMCAAQLRFGAANYMHPRSLMQLIGSAQSQLCATARMRAAHDRQSAMFQVYQILASAQKLVAAAEGTR